MKFYKILNSKIAWLIYFMLPTIIFYVISLYGSGFMEALKREGLPMIIALLLFNTVSWIYCKFLILDRFILKRINLGLANEKREFWKDVKHGINNFLWDTIPGLSLIIIGAGYMLYVGITEGSVLKILVFGFHFLFAISGFISISVKNGKEV